jgi:hypothetical protein
MRNALIALMVLTLLGDIQGLALAQQEAKQDQPATEPQTIEVTVYYQRPEIRLETRRLLGRRPEFLAVCRVIVYYAVVVDKDAKDVRIGPDRRTRAESEQDVKRWENEHPKSLLLAVVREKTRKTPARKLTDAKEAADKVKDAKEAVDKAKEIREKGLTAKERQLGDTLKEYTNRIKDTYENVKNLKSNLLSMTGKLSRKQFDEANKLIASYNKSRDELGKAEKVLSGARAERLKSASQPGSSGRSANVPLPQGPVAAPGNVSVLDRFPAMAPLDPNDFKDKLEPEKPAGKWTVWVYKNVGGKWEKQEDQSFSSDDQKAAEKYFNEAKERDGFTATTNLPASLFAGTTWAGSLYHQDTRTDSGWMAFSGCVVLITLKSGGKCYILRGDDDSRDVIRQ